MLKLCLYILHKRKFILIKNNLSGAGHYQFVISQEHASERVFLSGITQLVISQPADYFYLWKFKIFSMWCLDLWTFKILSQHWYVSPIDNWWVTSDKSGNVTSLGNNSWNVWFQNLKFHDFIFTWRTLAFCNLTSWCKFTLRKVTCVKSRDLSLHNVSLRDGNLRGARFPIVSLRHVSLHCVLTWRKLAFKSMLDSAMFHNQIKLFPKNK